MPALLLGWDFEFLVLTAARAGEVVGATWDEIDLDARTWEIPSGRMEGPQDASRSPV